MEEALAGDVGVAREGEEGVAVDGREVEPGAAVLDGELHLEGLAVVGVHRALDDGADVVVLGRQGRLVDAAAGAREHLGRRRAVVLGPPAPHVEVAVVERVQVAAEDGGGEGDAREDDGDELGRADHGCGG